ncbi:hypothetical protein O3M35_007787 [Rhynocoris fuscipes]|uniref:Choline kinase alpha n=1 Tax=Rhynocoris fuscipes TaxID=488301 RepID=A0AAW1DD57_9HEMI
MNFASNVLYFYYFILYFWLLFVKFSGGLSNLLYYCALPDSLQTTGTEPKRLLLRLYGNVNSAKAIENLITESVIFALLSETQRGPRLFGVFSGGRLEEFIEARALKTKELTNPVMSALIADKMAQIHSMDVPLNKQPIWLWQTMKGWIYQIEEIMSTGTVSESSKDMMEFIKRLELSKEYNWLKEYLISFKSPVVFCHNDLQEGAENQLPNNLTSDSLVIIDFEYCSYNYRAFDFANHFCEWLYDYSNQSAPYFWCVKSNWPTDEKKAHFIKSYLKSLAAHPEYKKHEEDSLERIMNEVNAFMLASHFFWGLWSVINSTTSEITFDYWSYGKSRFESYYAHKKELMEKAKSN